MDTFYKLNTWFGLFSLAFLLLILYWSLKLGAFLLKRLAQENITNKRIIAFINRVLLLFKPIAAILIILGFISINYITHTILILVVGTFGYYHIKNYIFGLFLKMNPLVKEGAVLKIGNLTGELKDFLPFGAVFNTEHGESYISYTSIEQNKFSANSNQEDVLRQTLHVETTLPPDVIIDLLFDNPIVDFYEKPTIKHIGNNQLKLQYTLENGASTQDLITFLSEKNIKTISK